MDTLTFVADLVKTAGVPGTIAIVIVLHIGKRLDALTAAVLSLPERILQCQSQPKSQPPA